MAESFTIQISADLVRRLTSNDAEPKKPKKAKPKPQPQDKTKPASNAERSSSSGTWPQQTPIFLSLPLSPPPSPAISELEAIKSVLQESERVVEKLEKQEINMVQELTQRAKELREKEFKLPYQKPMPCLNEREDCLQCYKEHLKDPLKCASAVKTFVDCARRARQQAG